MTRKRSFCIHHPLSMLLLGASLVEENRLTQPSPAHPIHYKTVNAAQRIVIALPPSGTMQLMLTELCTSTTCNGRHDFKLIEWDTLSSTFSQLTNMAVFIIEVNWLEYRLTNKQGKTTFKNSWVADVEVTDDNFTTLVDAGRCRWKIESVPQAHKLAA